MRSRENGQISFTFTQSVATRRRMKITMNTVYSSVTIV